MVGNQFPDDELPPLEQFVKMAAEAILRCIMAIIGRYEFLEHDPFVRELVLALSCDGDRMMPEAVRTIHKVITDKLYSMRPLLLNNPFAVGPQPRIVRVGDVVLGKLLRLMETGFHSTNHLVRTDCTAAFSGISLTGTTGSGKSSEAGNLIQQLLRAFHSKFGRAGLMLFECDKRESHRQFAALRRIGLGLDPRLVFWRRLRFNPLQPPAGVHPRDHMEAVASFFADAFEFELIKKQLAREALFSLYRRFGCFAKDVSIWPDVNDWYAEINYVEGHPQTKNAVRARLKEFINVWGHECLAYARGITPDALENRCVYFQ